ncbi:5-formyltetrahydrofolate cyclo-ligase [Gordonia oryzae]|uniref:5-formyltetrahydrofolate cyclo-ligase n=1 Tax=Gordonia oryzae TaxID=2487349 RepID=A0A3N4GRZ8_9ACTN|nr:5-formyltetrahydrofolate cyclo-ligase [Gordonia oryzae]RPA65733.1 5-formyltetrahydrofolate cyclo-ligase [Gordonia oryzae]
MAGKDELRAGFTARRARLTVDDRDRASARLVAHLTSSPVLLDATVTVAAYVPVGAEPGSVALLDALRGHGCTVLLPVVPSGPPAALDWVHYDAPDSLARGRFGLLEPTGPRVGVDAISDADAVFVPALAVARTGVRLGRGAGYYDRSVAGVAGALIGIVYDHELVDDLPADAYDVPMGWALTPGGGFTLLR